MNEESSPVIPAAADTLPMPYKDRSAGLIVFGILTIFLGCLCGLFVPLIFFGQAMAAKSGQAPANTAMLLPGIALYAVMAVALVWLGIGSIMARRWARALLLIFSWGWLIMGSFGMVFLVFFISKMPMDWPSGNSAVPPAAKAVIFVVTFSILSVPFVILPAVWTFFYNLRDVKATCEAREPMPCWTDACPLPVLAFCIWVVISVPCALAMSLGHHMVWPFFGLLLSGWAGSMAGVAMAGFWSLAGFWIYKLDRRGWWLLLIALVFFLVSSLLTFARHDLMEVYRLQGYPETQIAQMQKYNRIIGDNMNWLMSLCFVLLFGYVLFIRKFFFRKA